MDHMWVDSSPDGDVRRDEIWPERSQYLTALCRWPIGQVLEVRRQGIRREKLWHIDTVIHNWNTAEERSAPDAQRRVRTAHRSRNVSLIRPV